MWCGRRYNWGTEVKSLNNLVSVTVRAVNVSGSSCSIHGIWKAGNSFLPPHVKSSPSIMRRGRRVPEPLLDYRALLIKKKNKKKTHHVLQVIWIEWAVEIQNHDHSSLRGSLSKTALDLQLQGRLQLMKNLGFSHSCTLGDLWPTLSHLNDPFLNLSPQTVTDC